MKRLYIIIIAISLLSGKSTYASWDEYHEIEENSPAYQKNNNNTEYEYDNNPMLADNNRYSYWNQIVRVPTADGRYRYTTRKYASRFLYNRDYYKNNWNPYYSTTGKRFYPNSNYKREVKAKKHYGILSSFLNWLI